MTTSRPRPLNALLTLLLLLAAWPAAPLHAAPTKADTLYNRAAADVQEHINTLRSLKTLYGHTDAIRNRIDAMHTEAADALAAAAADYRDAGDRLESQEDAIYAEGLKAFLDYVTAIGAAPATPAVRADVYDTAGRLRLKNATAAEATRTLPRGVYIMQRQKLVVR